MDENHKPIPSNSKIFYLKDKITIIISIMALIISGLSVYYTYINSEIEKKYKEILIEPHLRWEISTEDLNLIVANRGIGHARIKHITLGNSMFCIRSSDDKFQEKQTSFLHSVADKFWDEVNLLHKESNIRLDAKIRSSIK